MLDTPSIVKTIMCSCLECMCNSARCMLEQHFYMGRTSVVQLGTLLQATAGKPLGQQRLLSHGSLFYRRERPVWRSRGRRPARCSATSYLVAGALPQPSRAASCAVRRRCADGDRLDGV